MKTLTRSSKKEVSLGRTFVLILKTVWKDHKFLFMAFVLMALISGLLNAVYPKILQNIIDIIIAGDAGRDIVRPIVLFGLALFGAAAFKFVSNKINFYVATQVEDKWRYKALGHFYSLPLAWHDKHDSGEVGNRMDRGGSAIFVVIAEIFGESLFISSITLLFVLGYTLIYYPIFGLLLLVPLPFYALVTLVISRKLVAGQAKLNKMDREAGTVLYDGVSNVRAAKAFGKEDYETQNYAKKWTAFHNFEYKLMRMWFTQEFIQSFIEMGMRAIVLGYGAYAALNGQITVGEVVLILSYQQMTFSPLMYLNRVYTRLRRNLKRVSNLMDVIGEDDPMEDSPDAKEISHLKKEIIVNDVVMRYQNKVPALKNVSLKIPAGTTTALVGKSGSGKTTLALLLMRFYDPDRGKVTFDGVDLRKVKRSSLRKNIMWIPQDTSLFNRSIRDNIAYANPKASMKEVIEAAKLAHAHDFIMKTPNGYKSVIGERGVKLSGGQRQRIAIARALLAKPSVLILDEATSHLDSETEHAIKDSINKLHHKTTLVIIAHRLSTILHADQIAVMEHGKLMDVKKHDELLKTSKIYKALYDLQFHKNE